MKISCQIALAIVLMGPAMGSHASASPEKTMRMVGSVPGPIQAGEAITPSASATKAAPINLLHGTAPTAPLNDGCWTTSAGYFCRFNGVNTGPVAGVIPLKLGNVAVQAQLFGVYKNGGTTGADSPTASIIRQTSHIGGTPTVVNNALFVASNVAAGVMNYEWPFLSVLNNATTGGQNVAVYGQGNKQIVAAGPTWASVFEAREVVPINNPVSGTVGIEVDVRANGTDTRSQRVGVDFVCSQYNGEWTATQCGYGFRVQSGGSGTNAVTTTAYGILDRVVVGLDTSAATVTQAAVKLAQGQAIAFNAAATTTLASKGSGLVYAENGAAKVTLGSSGMITANGVLLTPLVFASLPTCNAGMRGAIYVIADSLAPAYNGAAAGGGTILLPVLCNGATWTNH